MKRFTALLALVLLSAIGCRETEPEMPTTVAYTIDNRPITCLAINDVPASCDWNAWKESEY